MPSDKAVELAKSIMELLARDEYTTDEQAEIAARRIDGFHQSRREEVVKECSDLALRMGNAANSAAQRAACIAVSKAMKDIRKTSDERIQRVADIVRLAFATLLAEHELDETFAQKMAVELVNQHQLIVQWVTRVGDNGLRIKANGVTVEVDATPTEDSE